MSGKYIHCCQNYLNGIKISIGAINLHTNVSILSCELHLGPNCNLIIYLFSDCRLVHVQVTFAHRKVYFLCKLKHIKKNCSRSFRVAQNGQQESEYSIEVHVECFSALASVQKRYVLVTIHQCLPFSVCLKLSYQKLSGIANIMKYTQQSDRVHGWCYRRNMKQFWRGTWRVSKNPSRCMKRYFSQANSALSSATHRCKRTELERSSVV